MATAFDYPVTTLDGHVEQDSAKCVEPLEKRPAVMNLPDLVPWFDNVSDEYHELPCGDYDASYDE
jgi:hypothetical protein